jgi:CheY-like chemotaxis protein
MSDNNLADLAVLVVDENPDESTLITSAIALLQPLLEVHTVASVSAALDYLKEAGAKRRLVILGSRALAEVRDVMSRINGKRAYLSVVGFAADIGREVRQRALDAGVCAVYERPFGWNDYRDAVTSMLAEWLGPQTA